MRFDFKTVSAELPLLVGGIPIFSRDWGAGKPFDQVVTDIPIGSGPYKIGRVSFGRDITYQRDPEYWARDLNVRRGMYNFDRVTIKIYKDNTAQTEAFKAGASGYLIKRSAASELKQAIHAVMRGQHYITPLITKDVLAATLHHPEGQMRQRPVTTLTPRQREVLQLVAEGNSTKAIASILHISVKTVEFHKARIMDLLDLHSTVDLTKYAVAEGLISL